jgi:hypothetical protein
MQGLPPLLRLTLEVDDDPLGCFSPHDPRIIHMTEVDALDRLPCPNRRCRGGGLNVEGLLAAAYAQGQTVLSDSYRCDGSEGQGRRLPCGNVFKVRARFEVAVSASEKQATEPRG